MPEQRRVIQIQVTGVTENDTVISFVSTDRKHYYRRTDRDGGVWIYIDRESVRKLRLGNMITFIDIGMLAVGGSATLQRASIENDVISCRWAMTEEAIITGEVISISFC